VRSIVQPHLSRLHFLNDPKQPYVLHGDTCAFEQDVSTANILPRAPADMEGYLSVVFIGPKHDIAQAALKNIFRIRKILVLDFLRTQNSMYSHITIDPSVSDLYDDNGVIPSLSHLQ